MGKRRVKKRTHVGHDNPRTAGPGASIRKDPKSMVIRIGAGEIGPSVSQLAADLRKVVEPGTASRLKERRANKLRDYVTMCGPLGVTHLLLFSRSPSGNTNLRLAVTPRGPTLNFKVEQYTLAKDVQRAQRRPRSGGNEYITHPLLIMNHFTTDGKRCSTPKHLESLVTTMFQSLFPPINPQSATIRSIKRVLLLNREVTEDGFVITLRHYAITTKVTGMSRPIKRLDTAAKMQRHGKGLPNLGKLQDISEFLTGNGGAGYMTDATSGSELDSEAEIEVIDMRAQKMSSRKKTARDSEVAGEGRDAMDEEDVDMDHEREPEEVNVEKRVVKLVELGPRMRLRLAKVEEGLCGGKVMWHQYIHKTPEEVKELEVRWEKRRKEKEKRRQQQMANVAAQSKDSDESEVE